MKSQGERGCRMGLPPGHAQGIVAMVVRDGRAGRRRFRSPIDVERRAVRAMRPTVEGNAGALGMKSQDELMNLFLEKGKLALNSGTDYGPEGSQFARMNLACPRSLVEDGLRRLKAATEGL